MERPNNGWPTAEIAAEVAQLVAQQRELADRIELRESMEWAPRDEETRAQLREVSARLDAIRDAHGRFRADGTMRW